jgi:hypothetical protein
MQLHTAIGEIVITPASIVGAGIGYGTAMALHYTGHTPAYWAMGGYTLTNLAVGLPINFVALDILGVFLLRPLSIAAGLGLLHHFLLGTPTGP